MTGTVRNSGSLYGSMMNEESISGVINDEISLNGLMMVGESGSKDAVLYIPQELTEEQREQAKTNIRVPGKTIDVGLQYAPYTVDEDNDHAYIYDDPVEAQEGAEIFNDYANNMATGYMSQASGYMTQAIGNYSRAGGWWTRAEGQCSVAEGLLSVTKGHFCHAEGTRTQATINNAHSEGDESQATGRQSHSEGQRTIASGFCAHAEGSNTKATNYYSHSEGLGTISGGRNQTAMGKYNIKDTTSLLIVGNGTKDAARSNAFTLSSAGAGWFAGTVTSTGADYAEYFEWSDGNQNKEDRIGMVVTLDGDKIRIANSGDDILGVVTGTALVLGDNAEHEWCNKYLTDNYGRIIYEDVEEFVEYFDYETNQQVKESIGFSKHPKINPEYDPNKEYQNREKRFEWDAIGMLGKLHVNDDGTCNVGGYAKISANGTVTSSYERTNMRVIKRVTDSVILIVLK